MIQSEFGRMREARARKDRREHYEQMRRFGWAFGRLVVIGLVFYAAAMLCGVAI